MSQLLRSLFGPDSKELPPFKPSGFFVPYVGWFVFLARDCSYVARASKRTGVELLMDGEDVVGFKVWNFLALPREERNAYLQATGLGPDDIGGIEHLWLHNIEENKEEIFKAQSEFFDELRRRIALGLIKD